MVDGLSIADGAHKTRLKWHRLRTKLADPEFGSVVVAEGFRIGASMELDLRVRRDGGFVVVHDATLERETTGHGPVSEKSAADLTGVIYQQSQSPLILSENLASMMHSAHPDALLQFDMKDDLRTIGEKGLDHLVQVFGQTKAPIIFSGGCADLIQALATRLPHLPRGIDPSDRLFALAGQEGFAACEAALIAELRSGIRPDTCYLYWELVLAAKAIGPDLVAICHAEGVKVDIWTYTLTNPAAGFSDLEWAQFSALMALHPDQITTDEAIATEAAWAARKGHMVHD